MSSQFDASDGCALKARVATKKFLRKLKALGFEREDVSAIIHDCFKQPDLTPVGELQLRAARTSDHRLERARAAVRQLMAAGFNEAEIALLAGVAPSSISHPLNYDRSVSVEMLAKLETVLNSVAYQKRLKQVFYNLPLRYLDACGAHGRESGDEERTTIENSIRHELPLALAANVEPLPAPIPGLTAVLFGVGNPSHNFYGMKLWMPAPHPQATELQRALQVARHKEHEVEHLLNRLRQERAELEQKSLKQSARKPSSEGRIA